MAYKTCRRCERKKLTADFYRDKRARDGLFCYCKACENQRNKEQRCRNKARYGMPRKPKTKTCKYCRRPFKTIQSRAKYCSRHCAGLAKKARRVVVTCQECGKDFRVAPSNAKDKKYCSRACFAKARRRVGWKICEWCGGKYKPTGYKDKQKFCSKGCAQRRLHIIKNCEMCGNPYRARKARSESSRFCSRKCQDKSYEKQRRQYDCEICGKTFQGHAYTKRRFCSKGCAAVGRRGPLSPNWRGGGPRWYGENWIEQRAKALKRDKHCCQVCGAREGLHVHHLIPFRLFKGDWKKANRLSNLKTLCMRDHRKVEKAFWEDYEMKETKHGHCVAG